MRYSLEHEELVRLSRYTTVVSQLAEEDPYWRQIALFIHRFPTNMEGDRRRLQYFDHMERMAKKDLPAAVALIAAVAKHRLLR